MVRLTRELHSLRVPVDVVVVSEEYAEDWGGVEGTVVHAALTEGRDHRLPRAASRREVTEGGALGS
jgi:hypothetical protein